MARGPGQELLHGACVHDALRRYPDGCSLLATEALPFELSGRVGIGVDRHQAVQGQGEVEQVVRRIETLWSGIDLDGRTGSGACRENGLRVETRLGAPPAHDDAAGAV